MPQPPNRRDFARLTAAAAAAALAPAQAASSRQIIDDFDRRDSFYAGDGWHSLNPGYWEVRGHSLRRKLRNVGDRARKTGFPFHAYMETEYESMPPYGMIWRRDWRLQRNYSIAADLRVHAEPTKRPEPGYSLGGVCFGSRTIYESWDFPAKRGDACWFAAWRDDGRFGLYDHATGAPVNRVAEVQGPAPKPGDEARIEVEVSGESGNMAIIDARLTVGGQTCAVHVANFDRSDYTDGHFGLVARGWLDFEVRRVELDPGANRPIPAPVNELRVAYPLGDSLREVDGRWQARFLAVFRQEGDRAEIRIAATEYPPGGWAAVPPAGMASIVTNDFRRATAVIDCTLPANPAETELFYTVWKDGRDVTADPRPGAPSYVGRLPRLTPPYKLCGLSCHAINGAKPGMDRTQPYQENWIHPQPRPDAYAHLEDYGFQVMLWEDDIWYLELVLYPPSTDDAYLIVMTTLANPTTRWQMMRHWNVLNPGDHDHGMDDVKGPEQLAVRNRADLGQDPAYMRRNFQIVEHLISGADSPSGIDNPKRWRRWTMPDGDFSLLVMDSRLWRSSQDTHIWETEGWAGKAVYERTDPTRSLLGEEQFAWLEETLKTDCAPIICLTGINGMHTIWQPSAVAEPRNRIAADYAGWVKAGCDRVIELLSSREGVVTVYGDVHVGSIVRNRAHRLYECSFGPIGRTGGRGVKDGFGPLMRDYDGREIEVVALYHQHYETPGLRPQSNPGYWNFLEMTFDPRPADARIGLRLRRLEDAPGDEARGGGQVDALASETGRPHDSKLPPLRTLPNAEVRFARLDGRPVRGARSLADGSVPLAGLAGVAKGTKLVVTARAGDRVDSRIVETA